VTGGGVPEDDDYRVVRRQSAELALLGPVGSFDAYVDVVRPHSGPEPRGRERTPPPASAADDDLDAARQLVLSHLRFVVHIARGYHGYGLPMGDLVQEGNVGLMKAVKRFDPRSACASCRSPCTGSARDPRIRAAQLAAVKVATTKAQRKLFFNLRKYKRRLGWLSAEVKRQAVARTWA